MMSQAPTMVRRDGTRAGYVVLTGLPNAGKSTLLNALVGDYLSIVTPKAQTTWQRVVGIRTEGPVQMIFLDTPGIVSSDELFHRSMVAEAEGARTEADVVIGVVDGAAGMSRKRFGAFEDFLGRVGCPAALAINKCDLPGFDAAAARHLADRLGLPVHVVSARRGAGLDELLAFVSDSLPAGPFLYPEDDIAAAPTRFFVQELVRETIFERFHQEIPYAVAVKVEEFRESEEPVYIAAVLYVERKSQKGIVVGRGGRAIHRLGSDARRKIEHFLGRRVYLDLWVKVWEGWRRKNEGLMTFGYVVPDDDA